MVRQATKNYEVRSSSVENLIEDSQNFITVRKPGTEHHVVIIIISVKQGGEGIVLMGGFRD